jgi:hypothetical protein
MNFAAGRSYSIVLMSRRPGAPYDDEVLDEGRTLIYQGHDVPKSIGFPNPKILDQQAKLPSGKLTENGKFQKAAEEAKAGLRPMERVRVYEKIRDGIWSYNGVFELVDSWTELSNGRNVFKFRLSVLDDAADIVEPSPNDIHHRRIIPTDVKLAVWQRDGGRCVICQSADNLHFDHVIPFSKGGSSLVAENVQLLCCRHNLGKHDRII